MASSFTEDLARFRHEITTYWPSNSHCLEILHRVQNRFGARYQSLLNQEEWDFLQEVAQTIRRILNEKQPQQIVQDDSGTSLRRNLLRRQALVMMQSNIAAMMLVRDQTQAEAASVKFAEELTKVIIEDRCYGPDAATNPNENAEIALRALQLVYTNTRCYDRIAPMIVRIIKEFMRSANHFLDLIINRPSEHSFLILKLQSALDLLQRLVRFVQTRTEFGDILMVQQLAPTAHDELMKFPRRRLLSEGAIKKTQQYRKYLLDGILQIFLILELAWQPQRQIPQDPSAPPIPIAPNIPSFGQTVDVLFHILQNLPPGTEELRLKIISKMNSRLTPDFVAEYQGLPMVESVPGQPPVPANITADTPLIDILGARYLDMVVDPVRMQGRGRPAPEIQLVHAQLLKALGTKRVDFSSSQIQKAIRLICRSLLDNSVPLSQKGTLICYLHSLNTEYARRRNLLTKAAQFEILDCYVELCRQIRPQLDADVAIVHAKDAKKRDEMTKFFQAQALGNAQSPLAAKKPDKMDQKDTDDSDERAIYRLEEIRLYMPLSQMEASSDVSETQKNAYIKVMWNLVASADVVYGIARELRQQAQGGSGTFLDANELKIMKRLLLHGCEVIHGISELRPTQDTHVRTLPLLAELFKKLRPLQLRDILNDIGPQLFARLIVAKTHLYLRYWKANALNGYQATTPQTQEHQGIVYLIVREFAYFADQRSSSLEDEHVCTFLEAAFDYVSERLRRYNSTDELGPPIGQDEPLADEIAALPKQELQEALVDLALHIGEQALKRPHDIRAKHIFFSVFVFCVKQAKDGALVADHYYVIIIRLFRDLCTAQHDGLVKEFLPMIQGLLETFLHSRDTVPYIEVTNHIFECMPAKLKSLLDYLPVISQPVVESMRTVAHKDLERPLNTLQLWVSGLGQFPEILDPAISHVLPELVNMLYKILYQQPNFPFKLLGKMGAKSRLYWLDQEVSTRRYSEGGLKIRLKDKHSGREVVLGIDAAIEVVLVKVFENPRAYSLNKLTDAFRLVKAALLCYIDADIDVEYIVARIIAAKKQGRREVEAEVAAAAKAFDSGRRHNHGSFLARGSEAHAFEKILRSLLFACSLPEDNPETQQVGQKVLKFMKWVTQYFTLLYICKDGQLQQSREDEVNPMKFLETISAFLLYNLRFGQGSHQNTSYFDGTVICLETMLEMLNTLFGDTPEILANLEIVSILIKKVYHLAYEQDLRKKLAVTCAMPALLKSLPALAIRRHSEATLDALTQILHTGAELSMPQAKRDYINTFELLFEKIGLFGRRLDLPPADDQAAAELVLFKKLTVKVFQNLFSLKAPAREIAAGLLKKMADRAGIPVVVLAESVMYKAPNADENTQPINWRQHLWREVESQANSIMSYFRGGYTSIQRLLAYVEVVRFCLRYKIVREPIESKAHTLLGIAEVLLKVLETEAGWFENAQPHGGEQSPRRKTPGVETPSSCAQKYMRLERLYISQNQEYDPYSHTLHPHELLSTQHFEVLYQAKRRKEQGPDEALREASFRTLEIFSRKEQQRPEPNNSEPDFGRLNSRATEPLSEDQQRQNLSSLDTRVSDFIHNIFDGDQMGKRPSDINYDYVDHMYMLYPNVQLRTELICRCLEVLCDIVTYPGFELYLRDRQNVFFSPHGVGQQEAPGNAERAANIIASRFLRTKLDFYAVEIKAKVIAMYFKYFQREEENIIGTTKMCLERLLNESSVPAEALPNWILKEGVRPALNVLSFPNNCPRAFKHLTMLVEILHGCFNEQLAQHLILACQRRQQAVTAAYFGMENPQQPRAQDGLAAENDRRRIAQYNVEKVGGLETAKYIIQILHLLPNARQRAQQIVGTVSQFELQASRELETSHVPINDIYTERQVEGLDLRPLRVRFGVLQSEFRDGMAKFFNKNPVDCVLMLQQDPSLQYLILAILKMPGSYTVRERVAREMHTTIRSRMVMQRQRMHEEPHNQQDLERLLLVVRLVWTLTQFNSNFLVKQQHADVLEFLRYRWVSLADISIDHASQGRNMRCEGFLDLKKLYRKIMKCLLAYCRNEASDKQVLFDLLKGFSYYSIIDLTPMLRFFTDEVPNFDKRRQAGIVETALNKVEQSRGSHEQRYAMFEFAFMPIMLSCDNDQEKFDELFTKDIIRLFLGNFFGLGQVHNAQHLCPKWLGIQIKLEGSAVVFYEQFHVEIIKALNIIITHVNDFERLAAILTPSPQSSYQRVNLFQFLKELTTRATDYGTKEWASHALSNLCLKIVHFANLVIARGEPVHDVLLLLNEARAQIKFLQAIQTNHGVLQTLMSNLAMSHLSAPAEKIRLKNLIALSKKTVSNFMQFVVDFNLVITSPAMSQMQPQYEIQPAELSQILSVDVRKDSTKRLAEHCQFIAENSKHLGQFQEVLQKQLYTLLHGGQGSTQENLSTLVKVVPKVVKTLIEWETEARSRGQTTKPDIPLIFKACTNLVYSHLSKQMLGDGMPQMSVPKEEIEGFLKSITKILIDLVKLVGDRSLADSASNLEQLRRSWNRPGVWIQSELRLAERPLILRIFELNLCYGLLKYTPEPHLSPNLIDYVIQTIQLGQPDRAEEIKFAFMALKVIELLLERTYIQNVAGGIDLREKFVTIIRSSIEKASESLSRDPVEISEPPNRENAGDCDRRWDAAAYAEAQHVSRTVPHLAIRTALLLDKLAAKTPKGSQMRQLRESLVDFDICIKLVNILLHVVGRSRILVVSERPCYTYSDKRWQHQAEAEDRGSVGNMLEDDIYNAAQFEPELDHINKESIMRGLQFLARRMHSFPDEQASQILDNMQWLPVTIAQFRVSDYILEQAVELTDIIIRDEPGQERRLQTEKQWSLIKRILERLGDLPERRLDRKRDPPGRAKLQNKLFESCMAFLERQPAINTEYLNRLMEHLLIAARGRTVALKQRLFAVFERSFGQSLFAKLKFFFNGHVSENPSRMVNLLVISQLLDFSLTNFRDSSAKLEKLPHSAKLHRLSAKHIDVRVMMEDLTLDESPEAAEKQKQYEKIKNCLSEFARRQSKYMNLKLLDLMDPLSEVLSINPTYHDDKPIADILFTELFWQLWAILSKQEQCYIGDCINKMFLSAIKHSQTLQQLLKPTTTFARTMLESVAAISPQIRLAPELLQYMASQLNLWHVAIPILENQIVLCPRNERYVTALSEVYSRLHEEDYLAGLRRTITESEETRTIVTFSQHGKWEQINQLFESYIIYYAEQEGIYAHLDKQQEWPGKYSRQLPRQFLLSEYGNAMKAKHAAEHPDAPELADRQIQEAYSADFEAPVAEEVKVENFPREGPNNKVTELDLCVWETLFMESLKVLNKWEQFKDIAHLLGNGEHGNSWDQSPGAHEMWIEFFWQKKDWNNLSRFRHTLMNSSQIKHQLYYIFLIIQEYDSGRFDEAFRKMIQLAHQEWETQLPNYVDRAQFESLIMFQQVVESSEGGRSMIREARSHGGCEKLKELKSAMNIWRERVPHECEGIRTWKEVLENRNFIFEQLCRYIQPPAPPVNGGDGSRQAAAQQSSSQVELLDICWNLVKLAQVSRKHELPTLALYYQEAAEKKLLSVPAVHSEQLKFERFRLIFENLKLELEYNTEDPAQLDRRIAEATRIAEGHQGLELWMRASIRRVIADHYIDQGQIQRAQDLLRRAISEQNRRDPKLWLSYARLNEIVFEETQAQGNQQSQTCLLNALKGLLLATTLSLHKSRMIIPRIFRLLRMSQLKSSHSVAQYIVENTNHMPTWIWIFWAPQLLVMLSKPPIQVQAQHGGQQPDRRPAVEHVVGKHLLVKLVNVYPWAAYYPIRAKFTFLPQRQAQLRTSVRELLCGIKGRYPEVLADIEAIGREISQNVAAGSEETLCAWLHRPEIQSFVNRPDVPGCVHDWLKRLYDHFMDNTTLPLLRALVPGYTRDFLDEQTRERCILKSILRIKNLKDFLLSMINSKEQTTHLEELSPFLAHFSRRGIEIPGQHMLSEDEPLPQRTVYLDRFEPFVQRSGLTYRKIVFKGSNQKNYPFSTSRANDDLRICSEERATQLKVLMNMVFQRHKETLKRGVKFCVPSKLIMWFSKLSQDDLTFQDFQETHDFLLQEKGVDPDIALLLQIRWVRQLLDNDPERDGFASITQDEIRQMNNAYFEAMIGKPESQELSEDASFVPSTLLSSYFHRIFYNVDDLFLFKKRFTTYHAANSFFTYVFNDAEFQSLGSMSFCKSSGRLSLQEPRLKACLKDLAQFSGRPRDFPLNQTFLDLEAAESKPEVRAMPFRLTPNFVDFIGQIGLHGLFAGVMTSCSLASSRHASKLKHFLTLILKDEWASQTGDESLRRDAQGEQIAHYSAEYILFKIKSLSNHERIIPIPRDNEHMVPGEDDYDINDPTHSIQVGHLRVPKYMMELQVAKPDMPEEFNMKVFNLMDMALDDSRRRQMLIRWCPWF